MLSIDEDALVCDLAETYGILDMYSQPVERLAVLSCGLRENSRIWMKIANVNQPLEVLLLAAVLDNTAWLKWSKTKDAERGVNQPESVFQRLTEANKPKKAYQTGADFDEAKRIFNQKLKLLGRE